MCLRNMKESLYNTGVKTTYNFSGLEKKRGTICVTAEEHVTMSAVSQVLFIKKRIPVFTLSHNQKRLMMCVNSSNTVTRETTLFSLLNLKQVIIIIIMSYCQHGSPWPSPTSLLYRPLLPVGFQGYILYWHKAVVYRF